MCQFFSFLSDGKGTYLYADSKVRKDTPGKEHDSHTWLAKHFLGKGSSKLEDLYNKYEYNPFTQKFTFDERGSKAEDDSESSEKWVKELDFTRIVPELVIKHITNPLKGKPKKVTQKDIDNLKKWIEINKTLESVLNSVGKSVGDSVRNSVCNSVWNSVWNSVGKIVLNSVGNSVYGYMSSFVNIQYEFDNKPINELWNRGFVPSFDGKTWRLHSGKDAKIVHEITP